MRSGVKFGGQVVVGGVFVLLVQHFPGGYDITPADTHISFLRDIGGSIGPFFVLWVVVMIAASANAVNLTDGLDGLATGAAGLVLAAYALIGVWQERNDCTDFLPSPRYIVRDPLDLAVVTA